MKSLALLLATVTIQIDCDADRPAKKDTPAWQQNQTETMRRLDRLREKAREEASEPYPPDYDYSGVIAG